MKYATVGKENRKVYRVEAAEPHEVHTLVGGKIETSVEFKIPTASSHREIIKISNVKAARIAATADDRTTRWYIVDGELTDTKP